MTAATSSFSCRFVPHKCSHDELFLDSYLRTNRTNHTKIMRCFPHCCPGHRKRSYCGSPLFVQFDQLHVDVGDDQVPTAELAVYGRFRPLTASVPPLCLGARVSLSAIESSLQRDDPSMGQWIEAELSHTTSSRQDTTFSWVFEVNASARWYYPWSGAATIALRAMEHVFEVLVFRRVDLQQLELIADVASPPFRLMSFRRGVANSSGNGELTSDAPSVKPSALQNAVVADLNRTSVRKRTRADEPTTATQNKLKFSPTIAQARSLSETLSPTSAPGWFSWTLGDHSGASIAATNSLDALVQWLDELPLASAGPQRLAQWEQVVLNGCAASCAVARDGGSRTRRELVSFLSVLQVSERQSLMPVQPATPLDAIDAAVRTLLHLIVDPECSALLVDAASCSALDETVIWRRRNTPSRHRLMARYATWLQEIEYHARRFADTKTKASWSALAAAAAMLRRHQRRESQVDGGFGFRSFVAQRREWFAQRQRRHAVAVRTRRQQRVGGISIAALMNAYAPVFTVDQRVWVSRVDDVAIEAGSAMIQQSLSLLTALHFWRNLSCLRLEFTDGGMSGRRAQLCVASVFNHAIEDECFTWLTLDGQHRWFRYLPGGGATTGTTLMGYVVGDYIGRVTASGTIHVTTFLWPLLVTKASPPRAWAWHWTIDAACMARENLMTVSVVAESALIQNQDPSCSFDTMEITEKLRCVGGWDHMSQVEITYRTR